MRSFMFILIINAIPISTFAATLKVPSQYPTIQDAIDASISGDTVLVAAGTYVENIDFIGKAINLKSESGPDVTIIDGSNPKDPDYGCVVAFHNGEGPNTILEGFTITKGTGCMYLPDLHIGGGILCLSSSPTLVNNRVIDNTCTYWGGGIFNWYSSSLITDCVFSNNSASIQGGGMMNYYSSPTITDCDFNDNLGGAYGGGIYNLDSTATITRCNFQNNSAGMGGGIRTIHYTPLGSIFITHCTFTNNSADKGGGMYSHWCSPVVSHCTFRSNEAIEEGGGMWDVGNSQLVTHCNFSHNAADTGGGCYNFGIDPDSEFIHCVFSKNSAHDEGGGMFSWNWDTFKLTNCLFIRNSAIDGGGLGNVGSEQIVTNCVFYGNRADGDGGGIYNFAGFPALTNCILWGDLAGNPASPSEIYDTYGGKTEITFSNVQGGYTGQGNIDADPLFLDEDNDDFHLSYLSPCRNSGENTAQGIPNQDFEGDPRIAYGNVDMGADEFYTHLYWTGDATPGGNVEIKFVGLPGTSPVGLCIGTGVLEPPIPSMWGDWYLKFPIFGPVDMGSITSPEGVLIVPGTIPASPPPPYSIPMQALIGAELSNLCVLEVK